MNDAITVHFSYSVCGNQLDTYDCFAIIVCYDLPLMNFVINKLKNSLLECLQGIVVGCDRFGSTQYIATHNIPKGNVAIWQEVIKSRISSAKIDYYLKHTEEIQLSTCILI